MEAIEHRADYVKPQDFTNILMNILSVMKLLRTLYFFLGMFYVRRQDKIVPN